MDNIPLSNFIKYCLGYIKLTRERTIAAQQKYSINLTNEYFSLSGLLNGDTDGKLGELINLETFYLYDPNTVPEDKKDLYDKEKAVANKIQDIYSKHRNDQFTKQIILSFGYFEIELPIKDLNDSIDTDGEGGDAITEVKTKIDRYPLFSLPVRIETISEDSAKKYLVYSVDPEVQVNIGMLEPILGEDLYFQLLEEMGKYEIEGQLTLPFLELKIFTDIWHNIKAQLRLKDAKFDEESFFLEEIKLALSPRANYFLAEDLAKLTQMSEEDLSKTALTGWTQDDELNVESDIPKEKELYFPFLYDKYQLSTTSILGNKVAIIQGPPGTGKSETISNVICHLAATGKRVLFVSQKAQALKVVKDKLKRLDVKYLYDYLPNPSSAQIGEEDEADGIAPQLSALGTHIERLGHNAGTRKANSSVENIVEQKDKHCIEFNEIINKQREYYQLHEELEGLKEYDIDISDFKCFRASFSSTEWREIKNAKVEIEKLNKLIEDYKESAKKKEFDRLLSTLSLENNRFTEAISEIKEDVAKKGYDRHSVILRKANNLSRNIRLNSTRKVLPREIIDYIDNVLTSDLSRNDATKILDHLCNHCYYYENIQSLKDAKERLHQKLNGCGVSDAEFDIIDGKIDSSKAANLEEVKTKIIRTQEIKIELEKIAKSESANRVSSTLKQIEQERSKRVSVYIQNIINKNIIEKWGQGVAVRQIIQKLSRAFGKSKKAFKTFDNLRKDANNFNAILDLIPIWIMELDDASRIIPLEASIFDYVILDEASQCNVAYTLPVMYRAKKALFVGDSEQMRDSTIMFKSNRVFDELARRYQIPDERQIKATGSAVQSVLDIAKNRGFMYRTLHYHYRSPKELIGFSNKYFYKPNGKELIPINSNYLTYKDTNRIMVTHEVKPDWSEEISENTNMAEAKAILALFKEFHDDDRYRDKSIGILSFFNAQATLIRDLFEKEGFKEEDDNYKVSVIEGIQGDEKDIIIFSFVIKTPDQRKRYMPLTGEGGDIRGDINKGRVNVAFSRARLQVHCFVSIPPQDFPDRIWIKKYLEYIKENGEVDFHSTDLKPFDSYFEEDFYNTLHDKLKRGYKIQNQVESCGFKIDFVIGNTKTGKRIAVECDGPCHFKDEIDEACSIYIESDEERQRVLEAAGWSFCRIKYSDWIDEKFDRDTVVQYIVESLE